MNNYGWNPDFSSPHLSNLLYKPLIAFFGLEIWVFRILPLLFGILNTSLVYFFARRNFGERAAFFSTLLMLVSFYPTLASLQFDVEGNLVMFSILLMFFAYLEFEKQQENPRRKLFWQLVAGISLGVAVISKYNSLYIVFVLALYSLFKKGFQVNKIKLHFRDLFPVYFTGFLFFALLIIIGMAVAPENTITSSLSLFTWYHGFFSYYNTGSFSPLAVSILILWSTPLLLGFYFVALFKRRKENYLLVFWITLAILFYTFVMGNGSIDRYLMNLIPAFCLLGGYYLSRIKFTKLQTRTIFVFVLIYTSLLFFLNSLPLKSVARFPYLYLQELKHLNLNFLFAYTSASGPTFGVNFAAIFLTFLSAYFFLAVCVLLIKKRQKIAIWSFVFFLAISFSFNLFLVSEYLFHPTGVDVSNVKYEMMDYARELNAPGPIYSNDEGILWYFDHRYWVNKFETRPEKIVPMPDNELDTDGKRVKDNIQERGGTIILLHWPPLPEESPAWSIVNLCPVQKKFYSQEILVGEVYLCDPPQK